MRTLTLLSSALVTFSLLAAPALASSTKSAKQINASQDIDTLGGNKDLMEMATKIKSESRSRIVQQRMVDRNNTLEFGLSYGSVFSGDAYLKTQTVGFQVDYHITPRWSLGARYLDFGSTLSAEGQRIFDDARASYNAGGRATIVDIDAPQNATMAVLNWYPIYGKTSFLDMGVNQFDIYLLAGGGSMNLASGNTSLLTAGVGLGAWITKHVSARAEIRMQKYEDQLVTGARNLNTVVGSLGLGWIL
ncbi:outer membrane beta-barrel domain-containing protein [Bdellovibrio reynosensis]|uniref:Outer membrane beta-barrel domain-containing protein n=1 Tax=Bdellovibrio reynosensis TaxID=2835041 RepID=A0ABY4CJ87_9BACT|nr:outer membrane beta-barrel domain-containing protein [Bdellovibrio reynosensis]UOF02305.1 outer membrane beta-barrel domain-containing protein [Bdellovibrio reynosensis]